MWMTERRGCMKEAGRMGCRVEAERMGCRMVVRRMGCRMETGKEQKMDCKVVK